MNMTLKGYICDFWEVKLFDSYSFNGRQTNWMWLRELVMFQLNQISNGEQFESKIPQKHVTCLVCGVASTCNYTRNSKNGYTHNTLRWISHFLSIFMVILIFIPFSRVKDWSTLSEIKKISWNLKANWDHSESQIINNIMPLIYFREKMLHLNPIYRSLLQCFSNPNIDV